RATEDRRARRGLRGRRREATPPGLPGNRRNGRRRGGRGGGWREPGCGRGGSGWGESRGGRLVVDADAEVGGDPRETVRVSLTDRAHLPRPLPPVQLDGDQRG